MKTTIFAAAAILPLFSSGHALAAPAACTFFSGAAKVKIVVAENPDQPNPFHPGHLVFQVFSGSTLLAVEPILEKSIGIRFDRYRSEHYFLTVDNQGDEGSCGPNT
jgi:hypothetical protein